jgi:hypothetical protein
MARWALARTKPGTILIFHDGFDGRGGYRGETVKAVRLTVEGLQARGYRFVTVDELLGVPAYHHGAGNPTVTVSAPVVPSVTGRLRVFWPPWRRPDRGRSGA